MKLSKLILSLSSALLVVTSMASPASALSLKAAVRKAIDNNPEVVKSIENREATEFELQQARGLFLPSLDLEASLGSRKLDSPSRRSLGTDGNSLFQREVGLTLTQRLLDSGGIDAEVDRQAARVDAASFRVLERSEAIALAVAREYFEIMLQASIVSLTERNRNTLQSIGSDISAGVEGGTLNNADKLQARERVQSANADLERSKQDLEEAKVRFERLVGETFVAGKNPPTLNHHMPKSLHAAVLMAGRENPRIASAQADIDVAKAEVRAAESQYLPRVDLEASARNGQDIDGSEGETTDLQANVVLRWNLLNGGRTSSLVQERIRRTGERQADRDIALREVRELIKSSWIRRDRQQNLARKLGEQANLNGRLVSSYKEQLDLGTRSTLDLLSVQNTRFTSQVASKTAQYTAIFANYEILAAIGILTNSLHTTAPEQTDAYARDMFFSDKAIEDVEYERVPSRQVAENPFNLLTPVFAK